MLSRLLQTTRQPSYPPALTGLRGSHAGSFETFHALKDGTFWDTAGSIVSTRETYDLAVVGGGISGLAAAYYYRKAVGKGARIIVLDNHDDFGGHAKRNEFTANGRMYLGFGGTQSIDSPAPYSPVAKALITELGIDVSRAAQALNANLYAGLGLQRAFFFDRETFGVDRLVSGYSRQLPDDVPTSCTTLGSGKARCQAPDHGAVGSHAGVIVRRQEGPSGANELCAFPDAGVGP